MSPSLSITTNKIPPAWRAPTTTPSFVRTAEVGEEEPTWSSGTRRKLAVASSVFFQGQPGSFSSRSCSCTVASRTLSSPRAWYASSGTQRQKLEREATDMSIAPRFALPRRASRRSGCESVCQSNAIAVSYLKYREPIFQPWTLREAWSAQVFMRLTLRRDSDSLKRDRTRCRSVLWRSFFFRAKQRNLLLEVEKRKG